MAFGDLMGSPAVFGSAFCLHSAPGWLANGIVMPVTDCDE
jgi:hypothetical protein